MENIQDSTIFELNIDEEGKSNFSSIAQWANISAMVGFAGIGISIVSFVLMIVRLDDLDSSAALIGPGLGMAIGLVISLVLNIVLINAATNLKKGVDLSNQGFFETGLTKLATYFRILGILTIIGLVIFSLALLVGILAGVSRSL
jgi:hypothetical protein